MARRSIIINTKLIQKLYICGVPAQDIAKVAGVTLQTVYNYFKKITTELEELTISNEDQSIIKDIFKLKIQGLSNQAIAKISGLSIEKIDELFNIVTNQDKTKLIKESNKKEVKELKTTKITVEIENKAIDKNNIENKDLEEMYLSLLNSGFTPVEIFRVYHDDEILNKKYFSYQSLVNLKRNKGIDRQNGFRGYFLSDSFPINYKILKEKPNTVRLYYPDGRTKNKTIKVNRDLQKIRAQIIENAIFFSKNNCFDDLNIEAQEYYLKCKCYLSQNHDLFVSKISALANSGISIARAFLLKNDAIYTDFNRYSRLNYTDVVALEQAAKSIVTIFGNKSDISVYDKTIDDYKAVLKYRYEEMKEKKESLETEVSNLKIQNAKMHEYINSISSTKEKNDKIKKYK